MKIRPEYSICCGDQETSTQYFVVSKEGGAREAVSPGERNGESGGRCLQPRGSPLFAHMQPRFSMIEVELDAAQNFVVDDVLIAQLDDRSAFYVERVLL
jgi:hypothetical protein